MPVNSKHCLTIGLPKSGKTTYIAALWHVVDTKELDNSLQIESLPGDRTYLNEIRTKWLACENLDRTNIDAVNEISLQVIDQVTSKEYQFHFPDLSGEMFELQFESRRLDNHYVDKLQKTKGVLLFINPDKLISPTLINDTGQIDDAGEEQENVPSENFWKPKEAPTQVVLVDALQILGMHISGEIKISVIISAWDVIAGTPGDIAFSNKTPEEYIAAELPLLHAFLNANDEKFIFDYFGISAQGSEYGADNSKLQNYTVPSHRIKVQHKRETSNDLSLPIKWLLND